MYFKILIDEICFIQRQIKESAKTAIGIFLLQKMRLFC